MVPSKNVYGLARSNIQYHSVLTFKSICPTLPPKKQKRFSDAEEYYDPSVSSGRLCQCYQIRNYPQLGLVRTSCASEEGTPIPTMS